MAKRERPGEGKTTVKRVKEGGILAAGIASLAVVLYAVLFHQHYVGFLADDADYILAARSLLQGSYSVLYLPSHPPLIHYLPGFPFFLAPFVALFGSHWLWLPVVTIALVLVSGYSLWEFSRQRFELSGCLWVLFLFLFNPVTGFYSNMVISDFLFTTFVLWILFRLDPVLENPSKTKEIWFLGLLTGWAVLTRPEGLALLLALGVLFIISPSYRSRLIPIAGVGFSFWLLWMGRNLLLTGHVSDYVEEWNQRGLPDLLGHAVDVVSSLLACVAGSALGKLPALLRGLIEIATLGLVGKGVCSAFCQGRKPAVIAAALFMLFYLGIHVSYRAMEARYYLPLLPLMFFFLVYGINSLFSSRKPATIGLAVCILFSVSALAGDASMVAASLSHSLPGYFYAPEATFQWVRDHTPPAARVLSDKPSVVYLYTGRSSYFFPSVHTKEELRYVLLRNGIDYVFVFDHPRSDWFSLWWAPAIGWLETWSDGFRVAYRPPAEPATVYQVIGGDRFKQAFELYISASKDFRQNSWQSGFAKLDEALRLYPSLPSALNDYGAALLNSGGDLHKAEHLLQQSLSLQPGFPTALANLAQAEEKLRQHHE